MRFREILSVLSKSSPYACKHPLKGIVAVSNGSACTASSYQPSHVLAAMNLDPERIAGAIRVSFSPFMEPIPYEEIRKRLSSLL